MADEEGINRNISLAEKVLEKNKSADISAILAYAYDKKEKSWAKEYFFSAILAPIGVYYFFKYVVWEEYRKPAIICLILSVVVFAIEWKLTANLFSGTGISGSQILNVATGGANLPNPYK